MRSRYRLCLLTVLLASPALAQSPQVYAYDAAGRLTTAGSSSSDTTAYGFDQASNRVVRRCCLAIGTWQVKADGFDPYFYLQTYPDIRASGVDPYSHWLNNGASENRLPNHYFDTLWYRQVYGIPGSVNPLTEYHASGWQQGRNPSPAFSTNGYQQAYPDTAGLDPLQHFLRHGYLEGRNAVPVQ